MSCHITSLRNILVKEENIKAQMFIPVPRTYEYFYQNDIFQK